MTNAKHTPAPWITDDFGDKSDIARHVMNGNGNGATYICKLPLVNSAGVRSDAYKSQEANARLIAAAPETAAERDKLKVINAELLATLERILYAHDNHGNGAAMGEAILCEHYAKMARASIAKAKGE